jgi:hypothetical protein
MCDNPATYYVYIDNNEVRAVCEDCLRSFYQDKRKQRIPVKMDMAHIVCEQSDTIRLYQCDMCQDRHPIESFAQTGDLWVCVDCDEYSSYVARRE